jgi:hypothetical protein
MSRFSVSNSGRRRQDGPEETPDPERSEDLPISPEEDMSVIPDEDRVIDVPS